MNYECDAFVLTSDKEAEFLNSVESVKYLEAKQIPEISHDAKNWFFTNGWPSKTDAYRLNFNDGKKPMVAYLEQGIYGEAYEEGVLLIANNEGEKVTSGIHQVNLKDNRVMISDLNCLEKGLGDKVQILAEEHNSIYELRESEEKITGLLTEIGFSPDEIYINSGNRKTKSLTTVFRDHASAYQFAD